MSHLTQLSPEAVFSFYAVFTWGGAQEAQQFAWVYSHFRSCTFPLVIWFTYSEKWRWGGESKFCPGFFLLLCNKWHILLPNWCVMISFSVALWGQCSTVYMRLKYSWIPSLICFDAFFLPKLYSGFMTQWAHEWFQYGDRADTSVVTLFYACDRKLSP